VTDFKNKLCPFLSGATVAAQANVPETQREAVSCQGPSCALYMTILDETGKVPVGGNCAMVLAANALSHLNINVARGVEVVAPGNTSNLIAKG